MSKLEVCFVRLALVILAIYNCIDLMKGRAQLEWNSLSQSISDQQQYHLHSIQERLSDHEKRFDIQCSTLRRGVTYRVPADGMVSAQIEIDQSGNVHFNGAKMP